MKRLLLLVNVFLRLALLIVYPHVALKNLLRENRKQKTRRNDATIKNVSSYIKDRDLQEAIQLAILGL